MRKRFSLIELVVVIVLAAITAIAFTFCLREGFSAWKVIGGQKSLALTTRGSLCRMMRDIRRVKSSSDISVFSAGEVVFTDIDDNLVAFSREGTSLLRNGQVLQDNLSDTNGLVFGYLTARGVPAARSVDIASICVKLDIVDKVNSFVIQSTARIRN